MPANDIFQNRNLLTKFLNFDLQKRSSFACSIHLTLGIIMILRWWPW